VPKSPASTASTAMSLYISLFAISPCAEKLGAPLITIDNMMSRKPAALFAICLCLVLRKAKTTRENITIGAMKPIAMFPIISVFILILSSDGLLATHRCKLAKHNVQVKRLALAGPE
jgi:hypothetical protein